MIVEERMSDYIDYLTWQLPDYLKDVYENAVENNVPVIRKPMQTLLKTLLMMLKPKNILEVGTAVGFSSMLMSEYIETSAHITTIEKVPARIKSARENFDKYDKNNIITLIEGDATQVLKDLGQTSKAGFEFIFMDAAKGQYMNFLPDILALLSEDGVLVTDNVMQDGNVIQSRYAIERRDRTIHSRMREYLYTISHMEGFETSILPVGDGVSISVRKTAKKLQ